MVPGERQPAHDSRPAPPSGPVFVSPGPGPSSPARWRRRFALGSVGLVALLTLAAALGYGLSRLPPAWWSDATPSESGAGERLQNSVITQLHLSRPTAAGRRADEPWLSDPWRVSIRAEDVNAWIAEELPGWLANREPPARWPAAVGSARVAFEDGRVIIGVRLEHGGSARGSSVISATLVPEVRADGSIWARASWVRIGRLPAPAGWVVPRLREALRGSSSGRGIGEGAEFVLRVLAGVEPVSRAGVIRLDDGRAVRLLSIEPRPGAVWITARTERGE